MLKTKTNSLLNDLIWSFTIELNNTKKRSLINCKKELIPQIDMLQMRVTKEPQQRVQIQEEGFSNLHLSDCNKYWQKKNKTLKKKEKDLTNQLKMLIKFLLLSNLFQGFQQVFRNRLRKRNLLGEILQILSLMLLRKKEKNHGSLRAQIKSHGCHLIQWE